MLLNEKNTLTFTPSLIQTYRPKVCSKAISIACPNSRSEIIVFLIFYFKMSSCSRYLMKGLSFFSQFFEAKFWNFFSMFMLRPKLTHLRTEGQTDKYLMLFYTFFCVLVFKEYFFNIIAWIWRVLVLKYLKITKIPFMLVTFVGFFILTKQTRFD